jgi:hypothetical protein
VNSVVAKLAFEFVLLTLVYALFVEFGRSWYAIVVVVLVDVVVVVVVVAPQLKTPSLVQQCIPVPQPTASYEHSGGQAQLKASQIPQSQTIGAETGANRWMFKYSDSQCFSSIFGDK